MRPHTKLLAAVAGSAAVLLAGCGGEASNNAGQQSGAASSSASSGPSQSQQGGQGGSQAKNEGVKWMDGFCGSLAEFSTSSQGAPQPKSQEPAELKKSMGAMLDNISQSAEKLVSDLDSMQAPPAEGGDKFYSAAKESYGKLRDTANQAKSELDKASDSDKQATKQAVQSASTKLQNVDVQKPIKQLQSNQQLAGAFQQAPTCVKLLKSAQQQQQQQGAPQQQPQAPQQQPQQPGN